MASVSPTIIVHGGCGRIPDEMTTTCVDGVKRAVQAGYRVLAEGGMAVDAVEAAVCALEDDPVFNAGTGSALTSEGSIEMDALIMDGSNLGAGAVACVKEIEHPIKLARLVMDRTDHVLLVGTGANRFAEKMGVKNVPAEKLMTAKARQKLESVRKYKTALVTYFKNRDVSDHDTVGAAAVDANGNVACATSTGGITAKMPGRVGDSPMIGSGGYADNRTGAVSTTGHGEAIAKVCLSKHIIHLMEQGYSSQEAAKASVDNMTKQLERCAGVVVVSNTGDYGKYFSSERMPWALAKDGVLHYGLQPGEDFTVKV